MSILAADTGSDATAYFDSSAVAPGETYRYQVLAVRGEKASQGSITAVVSVPESLVARAAESANAAATAPGNLTATLRDDHIGLRWTTPQEDGELRHGLPDPAQSCGIDVERADGQYLLRGDHL